MVNRERNRAVERVVIAGAGVAGRSLAADVVSGGGVVIGFLDDTVTGHDVVGTLKDVARVCVERGVDVVYFAIPSAGPEVIRDFVAQVPTPEVQLAVVPRTYRIVSSERVAVSDLTDVDVLDVVGRAPVKHDMVEAREAIEGHRVLVTGAAGSIGSRIVSQIQALSPTAVLCFDQSESGMFHLSQQHRDVDNVTFVVGDVQSQARIEQVMNSFRPDIVFHVAAYKHVPLMQHNPVEAFNNNVWGTLNVVDAAVAVGVERLVYVSTDKAVNPTNVMGATKRLGELALADIVPADGARFTAVRFGNVLESEGSVMQTFRRQLERRENLTVTHPDITRYFMTIDEAAQLVIQSATRGKHGDLFVLDMGDPIRVLDLAQGLIEAVDPSLGIEIVGLRPGEKMFEELSYRASAVDKTTHPKIFVVTEQDDLEPGQALAWMRGMLEQTRSYSIDDEHLKEELRQFGFVNLQ